jgi:hypothetical protein
MKENIENKWITLIASCLYTSALYSPFKVLNSLKTIWSLFSSKLQKVLRIEIFFVVYLNYISFFQILLYIFYPHPPKDI